MNLYLGLVHHPVLNKVGETTTTSVTNLDVHDISRSCRTFGVEKYFIITPLKAQHQLIQRILGHWETDKGSLYNPDRSDALSVAQLVESIEESIQEIEKREGARPLIAVTGAQLCSPNGKPENLVQQQKIDNRPCLLLFGTGWGLPKEVLELGDFKLNPIYSNAKDGYNHLSVRSAVAIYLNGMADAYKAIS